MATQTTHYNLIKPSSADRVAVGDLNDNADTIDGYLYQANERANQIADDYNTSSTYNIGDYCRRENYIYKCNSNSVTGNWDSTKWDRVKVMDAVETAEDGVDNAFKTMGVMGAKNLIPYPYEEDSEVDRGITWTNYADGTVTATGTASNDSAHNLSVRTTSGKLWLKNGQYILTGTPSGGNSSTYYVEAIITQSGSAHRLGMDEGSGITITVNGDDYGNDGAYVQVRIIVKKNQAIPVGSPITFYPMLRLATDKDSTWQPYAQNNKELTENKVDWASENVLGGKNLVIQPYTYAGGTVQQVIVTINDDYSISINGTAGNNFWIPLNGVLNSQYTLTLKKGKYRLSCVGFTSSLNSATFLGLIKAGETSSFVSVNGKNDTIEFSLTEDTNVFVGIRINSGEVLSHTLYPMLCFASVKNNEYAPFSLPNKVITERIQCDKTTAGTYTLQATVASNGAVTYGWVSTTQEGKNDEE